MMTTSRQTTAARGAFVPEAAAPAKGRGARQRSAAPQIAFVTADAALAAAVRDAVPSLSIMIAATPTALADLMLASSCVVVVVDVAALGSTAVSVLSHLAKQFPDIPVVAVGTRHDESVVASLISSGQIYRFLHRPISPERTRNFLDAALRRHAALSPPAAPRTPEPVVDVPHGASARPLDPRLILVGGFLAAIAVLAGVIYLRGRAPPNVGARVAATAAMTAHPATPATVAPAQDIPPAAAGSAPGPTSQPSPASAPASSSSPASAAPAVNDRLGVVSAERTRPRADRAATPPATAEVEPSAAPAEAKAAATPAAPLLTPAAEVATGITAGGGATRAAASTPSKPSSADASATAPAAPAAPLRKLIATAPEYPVGARTSGIEGWVDVKFTVNVSGVPEDVRTTGAKPAGIFDAAALEAVRHWRYEPIAAPQDVEQRVRFRLR